MGATTQDIQRELTESASLLQTHLEGVTQEHAIGRGVRMARILHEKGLPCHTHTYLEMDYAGGYCKHCGKRRAEGIFPTDPEANWDDKTFQLHHGHWRDTP